MENLKYLEELLIREDEEGIASLKNELERKLDDIKPFDINSCKKTFPLDELASLILPRDQFGFVSDQDEPFPVRWGFVGRSILLAFPLGPIMFLRFLLEDGTGLPTIFRPTMPNYWLTVDYLNL